jgi:hypothetical protein
MIKNVTKSTYFLLPLNKREISWYGPLLYNVHFSLNPFKLYFIMDNKLNESSTYYTNYFFIEKDKHEDFNECLFENDSYSCYTFTPSEYENNYIEEIVNLFEQGKYSKFPKKYKQQILKCFASTPSDTYQDLEASLFPKTIHRRILMEQLGVDFLPGGEEAEIKSIPDFNYEFFNMDLYKSYEHI